MKVYIAQIRVRSLDLASNFAQIKQEVANAKKNRCDLIVFSELCVSGYLLADQFLNDDFCQELDSYNERICELSDGIAIIFGNIAYNRLPEITIGRDGYKPRFNAAFCCYNQEFINNIAGFPFYIKHLNPDYRYFDDSRYFMSGIEVERRLNKSIIAPFKLFDELVGVEICEDLWDDQYDLKVTSNYQNCDLVVNLSASPYCQSKEYERISLIQNKLLEYQINNLIYVNCVGMQNNGKNVLAFDGESMAWQNQKLVKVLSDNFTSDKAVINYDVNNEEIKYYASDDKLLNCLISSIKYFDEEIFNSRFNWVIGLSGGLDSTINLALLVLALGPERIKAYNMASVYNSNQTKSIASTLAEKLNVKLFNGSIEKIVKANIDTLNAYGYEVDNPSLTYENLQARTRGSLLGSFASLENGVICNNGNKVEIALGYCTLYGDTIGCLSPIGDLLKTDLFVLAKEINKTFDDEIIPMALLPEIINDQINWQMPPSAELKSNQVDPMKWYYHDALIKYLIENPDRGAIDILEGFVNGSLQKSKLGKWLVYYGLTDGNEFVDDLCWLLKTMRLAYFKRIQMPPIISISKRTFGYDYRESQGKYYESEKFHKLCIKARRV